MTCDEAKLLLGAYFDDELRDPLQAAQVAEHIETCASCAADIRALEAGRAALKLAPRYAAPRELLPRRRPRFAVLEFVTGIAAALVIFATYFVFADSVRRGDRLAMLEASHARALVSGRLVEFDRVDGHQIRPWLADKLGISPPAPRLLAYPLQGARVDRLGTSPAAVLVYGIGRHEAEVYVIEAESGFGGITRAETKGFQVRGWRRSGLQFLAISDASPDAVDQFTAAYREAP